MKNLNPEFCKRVKAARKEAGLGQSQLAAEIGCKQPALSMFEQGDGTKLSDEYIEKLAKRFSLDLASFQGKNDAAAQVPVQVAPVVPSSAMRGFCPNPHCPSNHEYFVEEMRLLRPDRESADPVGGKFCAVCGEVLERRCPSCGAPVHAGAICSLCGQPYVAAL